MNIPPSRLSKRAAGLSFGDRPVASMNVLEFTVAVGLGSVLAGFLGALTGLGGGVVIVPLLVLGFGVDIRYAIGASPMSVIATSSGAAAAYLQEGYSNIRVGMFLEVATTLGALSGATLASRVPANGLAVVFGFVLLYSAYLSGHRSSRWDSWGRDQSLGRRAPP